MSENLISGVLKLNKKGNGTLRDPKRSFRATPQDPMVAGKLVKRFGLTEGAMLEGTLAKKGGDRRLDRLHKVCGLEPEAWKERKQFEDLIAIHPDERFNLSASNDLSMRIIDLVAPIGKGTRGLIVSPPKAGKTTILEQIAKTIREHNPDSRVIMLLIDERPEEVTHFRRSTGAEVLASSSDQPIKEHVELAELTLAHIRSELEAGHDVVVLVDSLTRMGRAFNLSGSGKGRTMSGGVEAGALEIPRRFFGCARNIEDGGSVTIVASALIDTGSRMDQLIFEEFKGTGNSEIVLDRTMAEQRVFPAIDLAQSGTRQDYRLHGEDNVNRLNKLRRVLSDRKPKEALLSMTKLLEKHPTNEAFLKSIQA